jgi:hypothetical protein
MSAHLLTNLVNFWLCANPPICVSSVETLWEIDSVVPLPRVYWSVSKWDDIQSVLERLEHERIICGHVWRGQLFAAATLIEPSAEKGWPQLLYRQSLACKPALSWYNIYFSGHFRINFPLKILRWNTRLTEPEGRIRIVKVILWHKPASF